MVDKGLGQQCNHGLIVDIRSTDNDSHVDQAQQTLGYF